MQTLRFIFTWIVSVISAAKNNRPCVCKDDRKREDIKKKNGGKHLLEKQQHK